MGKNKVHRVLSTFLAAAFAVSVAGSPLISYADDSVPESAEETVQEKTESISGNGTDAAAGTSAESGNSDPAEVAESIKQIIYDTSNLAEADASQTEALQTDISETAKAYDNLTEEQKDMFSESKKALDNAGTAVEKAQDAMTQIMQNGTAEVEQTENFSSWRYINGQKVNDMLKTVDEEQSEAEAAANEETADMAADTNEEPVNMTAGAMQNTDSSVMRTSAKSFAPMKLSANMLAASAVQQTNQQKGIDVSKWEGNIDWEKVKNSGITFAILRVGYGTDTKSHDDPYFIQNAEACEKYGIPYGVYLYSYAMDESDIDSEIQHCLRQLSGRKLSLPVYLDMEDDTQAKLSDSTLSSFASRFCSKIANAGYRAGVYANKYWWEEKINQFASSDHYYHWVAEWRSSGCTANVNYELWQYSDTGRVSGINGNVDLDILYPDKMNSDVAKGWRTANGGLVTNTYTGFAVNNSGEIWYLENGNVTGRKTDVIYDSTGAGDGTKSWYNVVNSRVTKGPDVRHNSHGWWYINQKGKVDFSHNGVEENSNGWWKITNGKVDFGYNGFASNRYGTWYLENGKVTFNKTDVIFDSKGSADGSRSWYNVAGSKVTAGPTVAHNSNGWWYINKNGKVDFSYNGFASNKYGTWYLENGKVTFKKTDIILDSNGSADGSRSWYNVVESKVTAGPAVSHNSHGWWYINKNGKVDFSYNGFASNKYGTWYLENGKVTFKKTDVIFDSNGSADGSRSWYNVAGSKVTAGPTVSHNSHGWWYIDKNGKVDFSYNGFASNKYGTWYLENGKVTFKKTDVIFDSKGSADGSRSWYNVVGSRVTAGPTVSHNSNGWWYIDKNGKVDFSHDGVEKNSNGWWKITNGRVDFHFDGLAENKNGIWKILQGKVDFSYNGEYKYDGKNYRIKNGKAEEIKEEKKEDAKEKGKETKDEVKK